MNKSSHCLVEGLKRFCFHPLWSWTEFHCVVFSWSQRVSCLGHTDTAAGAPQSNTDQTNKNNSVPVGRQADYQKKWGKLSRGFVGCWDGFRLSRSCREGHTPTHPHLSSSANLHPFPPPSHTARTLSLHQRVCCAQVNVFALVHNLYSGKEASLAAESSITCKEHLGNIPFAVFLVSWSCFAARERSALC